MITQLLSRIFIKCKLLSTRNASINVLFKAKICYATRFSRQIKMCTTFIPRIQKRFILAFMIFIENTYLNYVRTNLGMSVVAMSTVKSGTNETKPEFDWDSKQTALVISSFMYGRLLGPIAGFLSEYLGGGTFYTVLTFLIALLSVISPFLLYTNFYLFVFICAIVGWLHVAGASNNAQLWSRWAPMHERSKIYSFCDMGDKVGSVMSYFIAGFILKAYTWPILYYITGVIGIIWVCIWYSTVSNDPATHPSITQEERKYIAKNLNNRRTEKLKYPWKKIFTCTPFLAGCLAKFTYACGNSFIIGYLPQYFKDTTDLEIDEIGYISTIPMFFSVLWMPFFGYLSDYTRKRQLFSLTNFHRFFSVTGLIIGGTTFIVINFWSNLFFCIICFSVYHAVVAIISIDVMLLIFDIAPRYAAFLSACANFCYTAGSILAPNFIGHVVTNHSRKQWNICFYSFGGIYFFTGLFYFKYVSGKLQSWADCENAEDTQEIKHHVVR